MEGTSERHPETNSSSPELSRDLKPRKLGFGAWMLSISGVFRVPRISYRAYILVLTFVIYAAYHMSRKPFSVVANVLAPDCNMFEDDENHSSYSNSSPGWPPFNGAHCKTLIGAVDYSWLFTYAVFLFISGLIADRVNLRYFLAVGMIGSGICVGLLGVAYYAQIHSITYFIIVQIGVGVFESTGWPGVVAVMGNWFGKKRRGLLLGVWNAHTSVGNILGTAVPAIWAVPGKPWGWSFLVPAFVMIAVGIIAFFFLITDPAHVGLPPPVHHLNTSSDHHNAEGDEASTQHRNRTAENGNGIMNGHTNESIANGKNSHGNANGATNGHKRNERGDTWPNAGDPGFSETSFSKSIREETVALIHSESDEHVPERKKAIGFLGALKIPGVIEFSMALFFNKLVAYTFLFWLPYYIFYHPINDEKVGEQKADFMATFYDVGGILGGITTGAISDLSDSRAISCVVMMYLAVPTLFIYRSFGRDSYALTVSLVMMCGVFINGPYAVITTAVSNDLGTHKSLKDNTKAKATVGAIIDGMGSLGAACGPLLTGWISDEFGWDHAFFVLMTSCFLSSLSLTRLLITEVRYLYNKIKDRRNSRRYESV